MRRLLLALTLFAFAAPAVAAEKKAEAKEPKDSKAAGQYVDVSPVALPVVVKGRLINYIFVSVRLNLDSRVDSVSMRAKEPYFRDALVRAGYRTPFTDPKSYVRLDAAAIKATMAREAAQIAGPKAVTSVEVTNMTAQKLRGLPSPPT
jgi:hypothetical protein